MQFKSRQLREWYGCSACRPVCILSSSDNCYHHHRNDDFGHHHHRHDLDFRHYCDDKDNHVEINDNCRHAYKVIDDDHHHFHHRCRNQNPSQAAAKQRRRRRWVQCWAGRPTRLRLVHGRGLRHHPVWDDGKRHAGLPRAVRQLPSRRKQQHRRQQRCWR